MRVLTVAILVVLALVVALVGLNWAAMTAPVGLSVGPTTLELPLGLTLLVLMSVLVALVAAYAVYLQGSALMEARRMSKEMLASRDLADKAEASRFTELRHFLEQLEARQRTVIEQASNSLAASVGELEDKVERALGVPRG
ncbi:LapA family protein [Aquabacterium sp. A3]|uniref:LapA family protein n=1 Tax=Aquabacterium sp. A3 TaxID=3132829 RepID=UPI0031196EDB